MFRTEHTLRGGAVVARQAHNLKAVGSIPAPATNDFQELTLVSSFFYAQIREVAAETPGFSTLPLLF